MQLAYGASSSGDSGQQLTEPGYRRNVSVIVLISLARRPIHNGIADEATEESEESHPTCQLIPPLLPGGAAR